MLWHRRKRPTARNGLQPFAQSTWDGIEWAQVHVLSIWPLPQPWLNLPKVRTSGASAAAGRQQLPICVSHTLHLLREPTRHAIEEEHIELARRNSELGTATVSLADVHCQCNPTGLQRLVWRWRAIEHIVCTKRW